MEGRTGSMKPNALIITGKEVQDHEFIYPYYRLKEAGYNIIVAMEIAGPTTGNLGTKIPCDTNCSVISFNQFPVNKEYLEHVDVLVIPGGAKCMEYLRQNKFALDFIAEFNNTGKTIASICHAAQLLISAKIVKSKKISGYYSIKDDIENAGAEYVDAPVVVDGNLITCPHYKHLGDWMAVVLESV